jgi:hypothetical protein
VGWLSRSAVKRPGTHQVLGIDTHVAAGDLQVLNAVQVCVCRWPVVAVDRDQGAYPAGKQPVANVEWQVVGGLQFGQRLVPPAPVEVGFANTHPFSCQSGWRAGLFGQHQGPAKGAVGLHRPSPVA